MRANEWEQQDKDFAKAVPPFPPALTDAEVEDAYQRWRREYPEEAAAQDAEVEAIRAEIETAIRHADQIKEN